ncbi:Anaerobic selenocysteine-containing dehydrogenase [Dethiosulfatibacter aminovorans DSM 17477]|uniref:Anaerobic selenocysteine-containing dehydrogenase n=1 Tax=Dethiosulfatibacter aminovorans DSM 17477 TaxID=1121476 RepID=A0A1M6DPN2_9FIRM|nr:molybdopterin-dependent oxidoreductase [Dethiosulfatibacter aminovorans]SHI75216.1 Anaerobic selenocysteine-containing dehydrogenase [Dethiosulfatibacter aminovorans DSM 17477]
MTCKPDGTYTSVCPRDCFGGCTLKVTIEDGKIVKVAGNKSNTNSDGYLCSKGASYHKRLYHPDRITFPMLKEKNTGEFSRISWDEALDIIARKLTDSVRDCGAESIMYMMGYGHMGKLNDYAKSFWMQLGSITSCYGSLCMAAGKTAVKYTYGTVMQNHNSDLQNARLIIVWGSNPANTNIHRMRNIKAAVKKGAKLIVIDPRVSETMIEGAVRIHPRGGTDGLLAMGIAKIMIDRNICNHDFIHKHVLGFEEYCERLKEYDLDEISAKTGIALEQINEVVDHIEENPVYAFITGSGKSRYSNGGQTERCVCILPALTGSIGVSGGGFYFSDDQNPRISWKNLPVKGYEINENIHVGKVAEALEDESSRIRLLWIEKANPLVSSPDITGMKKVMDKIDFIVTVEHFMTDTALDSDLVLPAAMFSEKDDIFSIYGDSYIQLMPKLVEPQGECKSEPEIYRLLGEKLGFDLAYLPVIDEDAINRLIKDNNINTTYEELKEKPYLYEGYNEIAYEDLVFDTPSGKIEIFSEQMKNWGKDPLPDYCESVESRYSKPELYSKYPLQLFSSHAPGMINSQFKEMKLSVKNSVPKVQVNSMDAEKRDIANGDLVGIYNDRGVIEMIADVGDMVREGEVHIYAGWGDGTGASVNVLIPGRKTDIGDATAYHDCLVEIGKV